jgi:hypothetical protein
MGSVHPRRRGRESAQGRQDLMAERYYFRLRSDDETIEDETGVMAESVAQAEAEALTLIDEFRRADALPDAAENWRLEIHDAAGAVLRTLHLA